MIIKFTEDEINKKINIIEVEDIVLEADSIEIKEDLYVLCGNAEIDGEIYNEFLIEFTLAEKPENNSATAILEIDWEEYDFVF